VCLYVIPSFVCIGNSFVYLFVNFVRFGNLFVSLFGCSSCLLVRKSCEFVRFSNSLVS